MNLLFQKLYLSYDALTLINFVLKKWLQNIIAELKKSFKGKFLIRNIISNKIYSAMDTYFVKDIDVVAFCLHPEKSHVYYLTEASTLLSITPLIR